MFFCAAQTFKACLNINNCVKISKVIAKKLCFGDLNRQLNNVHQKE